MKPAIEIDASKRPPLGLPPARFLRDYWQKHPLLIRHAFAGLAPPLSAEDLAGLACEETALSRLIQLDRATDTWSVRNGPFDDADFAALPARDWTLLVQDVDKWDQDVAALLQSFEFLPRWRIDDIMVSYAVPGGSVGAHVDQYDVFLLQVSGQRRWQIDHRADAPLDFRTDAELRLLQSFEPTHEWLLQPGDMLYLPPGVPHHGVAEDACLTFSVGMRAPAASELLVDMAEHIAERLPDSRRYTDPDLRPARDPAEIDGAAFQRLRHALEALHHLDEDELREWFGGFITRYRSAGEPQPDPKPALPARIEAQLEAGARLIAHPYSQRAYSRRGRRAVLFVNGEHHPCSLAAAQQLARPAPLGSADLQRFDSDDRALLHRLIAQGHFQLVPQRSARR